MDTAAAAAAAAAAVAKDAVVVVRKEISDFPVGEIRRTAALELRRAFCAIQHAILFTVTSRLYC